jgi:hypothetical protein
MYDIGPLVQRFPRLHPKWNNRKGVKKEPILYCGNCDNVRDPYEVGLHVYLNKKLALQFFKNRTTRYCDPLSEQVFLIPVYFYPSQVVATGFQLHALYDKEFHVPVAVVRRYYIKPDVYKKMVTAKKSMNLA